jgi:hypothetical protein
MALSAGTVSIHATTGAVTGSGYARDLYDIEAVADPELGGSMATDVETARAGLVAGGVAAPPGGAMAVRYAAELLARRQKVAAKCNAQAAAVVELIQTATVTVAGVTSGSASAIGVVT